MVRRKLPDALPCVRLALSASEFSDAPRMGAGSITSFFSAPSSRPTGSTSEGSRIRPYPSSSLWPLEAHDRDVSPTTSDGVIGCSRKRPPSAILQRAKNDDGPDVTVFSPFVAITSIHSSDIENVTERVGPSSNDQMTRPSTAGTACTLSGSDRRQQSCEDVDDDDVVLLEKVDLGEQHRIMEGIQRATGTCSSRQQDSGRGRGAKKSKGHVEGQRSILDMFVRKS